MKTRISQIFTLITVFTLAACAGLQVPITPTLLPTPTAVETADHFTFNGMELHIRDASLATDCREAFSKVCTDAFDHSCIAPPPPIPLALHPVYGVYQPKGKNCLLIVISTIPGYEYIFDLALDQFKPILNAAIADQNQSQSSWIGLSAISAEAYGQGISTGGYIFVDEAATSFVLILPDGRSIPFKPK
jgi:hypothetical protein